jgi:hypothetical protein
MRTQPQAFAAGERHDDIGGRMRNIARQMDEITAASQYYADRP